MSKKGVITVLILASLSCIGYVMLKGDSSTKQKKEIIDNKEAPATSIIEISPTKVELSKLQSDILKLIADGDKDVSKISPEDAKKELDSRIESESPVDKVKANVKELPFDILRIITKSPVTVAGIKPKQALHEIARRYIAVEMYDSEELGPVAMLFALKNHDEQKAIDKWADNEDAEAVADFMKKEADGDPSSVANFAYGLRNMEAKFGGEGEEAKSYMNRYAENANMDDFDNPNIEESYKELIDTITKVK